jgi:hypothetical protein
MDKPRFSQGQTVQSFDERHQRNFVREQAFANMNRSGQENVFSKNISSHRSGGDETTAYKNKRRRPALSDAAVANGVVDFRTRS